MCAYTYLTTHNSMPLYVCVCVCSLVITPYRSKLIGDWQLILLFSVLSYFHVLHESRRKQNEKQTHCNICILYGMVSKSLNFFAAAVAVAVFMFCCTLLISMIIVTNPDNAIEWCILDVAHTFSFACSLRFAKNCAQSNLLLEEPKRKLKKNAYEPLV